MDRATLRALALVSGLGFAIALPLGLFLAAGLWLDERLATRPLFMLVGILLGLIVAGATIAELLRFEREGTGRIIRRRPRRRDHDGPDGEANAREG